MFANQYYKDQDVFVVLVVAFIDIQLSNCYHLYVALQCNILFLMCFDKVLNKIKCVFCCVFICISFMCSNLVGSIGHGIDAEYKSFLPELKCASEIYSKLCSCSSGSTKYLINCTNVQVADFDAASFCIDDDTYSAIERVIGADKSVHNFSIRGLYEIQYLLSSYAAAVVGAQLSYNLSTQNIMLDEYKEKIEQKSFNELQDIMLYFTKPFAVSLHVGAAYSFNKMLALNFGIMSEFYRIKTQRLSSFIINTDDNSDVIKAVHIWNTNFGLWARFDVTVFKKYTVSPFVQCCWVTKSNNVSKFDSEHYRNVSVSFGVFVAMKNVMNDRMIHRYGVAAGMNFCNFVRKK